MKLQHSPLLGSHFRSDAFRPHSLDEFHTPPSDEFEQPLKLSGLLGRDPQSVIIKKKESDAQDSLPDTSRTSPSSQKPPPALRGPVITPFLQKRRALATFPEEDNSPSLLAPVDVLTEPPSLPTPNVLYRTVLNAADPPSPANFTQLNEFLDRLIAKTAPGCDLTDQNEAYEVVFVEVIRQYFIECSNQGRLLDKCRLFFLSLARHIPQLRKRFETELNRLDELIASNDSEVDEMRKQLIPAEEKRAHLQSVVNDLRTDYQLLTQHLDGLNRLIGTASKEISDMRVAAERLDSRIDAQHQKLVRLNEDLRTLDEVSAKSTADTVEVTDLLRKLLTDIEVGQTRVSNSRDMNSGMKAQLGRITAEITSLQSAIEESNKYVQMSDAEIQTDLVLASKRPSVLSDARRRRQEEVRNNPLAHVFEPGGVRIPPEGIVISTYDDFAVLKDLILANSMLFQMTPEDIKRSEAGTFLLDGANVDFLRLYSSRAISDIIDRAARRRATQEADTQTRMRALAGPHGGQPGGIPAARGNKFLLLIPADYSQRPAGTLTWMIKNIQMIYDEKWQADLRAIEKRAPFVPFYVFTFQMAMRAYQLEFLCYQFCWDLYITGQAHRESSLEVDMFMNALAEGITVEQLAFMLKCRDHIMKVGAVVQVRSEDQTEQITAYYMSQDQVESALQRWWKHRYRPRIFHHCMEFAVARPAMHLEATKRYVSMNDILAVSVMEFSDDALAQMHELLQKSRLVPRLTLTAFCDYIRSMIPYASDRDCDGFYRATVSKTCERQDVSQKGFRALFAAGSILYAHEEAMEHDFRLKELLDAVGDEWRKRQGVLLAVKKYFDDLAQQQPDNLRLRTLVTDATRYETMLGHSLTIKNATEACFNYFQLIFSLDLLFSVIPYFDVELGEASLLSLECCIKEYWLDSVFEKREQES